jgi:hypothetical protein
VASGQHSRHLKKKSNADIRARLYPAAVPQAKKMVLTEEVVHAWLNGGKWHNLRFASIVMWRFDSS